eukprot:998984-Ditylum_brightwellii.AAC.1
MVITGGAGGNVYLIEAPRKYRVAIENYFQHWKKKEDRAEKSKPIGGKSPHDLCVLPCNDLRH